MIKKAVPLALLLASSTKATPLDGTWTVGALPTGGNAATCCYLKPGTILTVSGTSVGGFVDLTSQATACAKYVTASKVTGAGASAVWVETSQAATTTSPNTIQLSTSGTTTPPTAESATVIYKSADSGATATFQPADNTSGSSTACGTQALTRSAVAIPTGLVSARYSAAEGSGAGATSCCFFDTAEDVAVSAVTTAPTKITVTGKLGGTQSQCAATGSSPTYTLKQGADATTFKSLDDTLTFSITNSGRTVTYAPSASCTQTLTFKAASSASRLAIMSPIVVGAAALGLAVV